MNLTQCRAVGPARPRQGGHGAVTTTFLTAVAVSPSASVTFSVTVCVPAVVKVLETVRPVAEVPSGNVQRYVAGA